MKTQHQLRTYRPAVLILTLILICGPLSLAFEDQRATYNSTITMSSDEAKIEDLCINFTGSMSSGFFEGLERLESSSGTEFRRSKQAVKNFPEVVDVLVWAKPYLCKSAPWKPQPKSVGVGTLNSLKFECAWKRDMELRPAIIASSVKKHFAGANQWFFLIEVRSLDVPLSDHLILSIFAADGKRVARLAGRL